MRRSECILLCLIWRKFLQKSIMRIVDANVRCSRGRRRRRQDGVEPKLAPPASTPLVYSLPVEQLYIQHQLQRQQHLLLQSSMPPPPPPISCADTSIFPSSSSPPSPPPPDDAAAVHASAYGVSMQATQVWLCYRLLVPIKWQRCTRLWLVLYLQLLTRAIPREVFSCMHAQWIDSRWLGWRHNTTNVNRMRAWVWQLVRQAGMSYAGHVFHNPSAVRSLGTSQTRMGQLLDYPCIPEAATNIEDDKDSDDSCQLQQQQQQNKWQIATLFVKHTPRAVYEAMRYYMFLFAVIRPIIAGRRPTLDWRIFKQVAACAGLSGCFIRLGHLLGGLDFLQPNSSFALRRSLRWIQSAAFLQLAPRALSNPPGTDVFYHFALGNSAFAATHTLIARCCGSDHQHQPAAAANAAVRMLMGTFLPPRETAAVSLPYTLLMAADMGISNYSTGGILKRVAQCV